MVFKGRFFSSKKSDTSSPDGSSSSSRSFGSNSNSPIRSDKKKPKSGSPSVSKESSPAASAASTPTSAARGFLKKKDSGKGKEKLNLTTKPAPGYSNYSPAPSKLKKSDEAAATAPPPPPSVLPTSLSVSPIMASSLGLNKIKTRSGPLPQESFFSFGSREEGAALGASNLSMPLGGGGGIGGRDGVLSGGKKKDKVFNETVDNGSNSDSMSTESGASRDQSPHVFQPQARSRLQNADSSSGATGQFNPAWDDSGALRNSDECTPEMKTSYECDNPKESESPRFQAILRVTSAPRKKFPGDIKSFSHELNSKGVRPYPFWKPKRRF